MTFTTTVKANRFFGPTHVVGKSVVPPDLSLTIFHHVLGVFDTTPLGTDMVVIEVTSSASGAVVLARCTFNLTVALSDVIRIPVRPCFLEGTALSFNPDTNEFFEPGQVAPGGSVVSLIDHLNDQSWMKDARIAFRAVSWGVPVIQDPVRPSGTDPSDVLGAVDTQALAPPRSRNLALQRWSASKHGSASIPRRRGRSGVRPQIHTSTRSSLRIRTKSGGTISFERNAPTGTTDTPLCQEPRQVVADDVTRVNWVILLEPDAPTPPNSIAQTINTLAHELGHALLLGHGNGLDDDANGGTAADRRLSAF